MSRLQRLDDWLERNAFLVLSLVLGFEALFQMWVALAYWPKQAQADYERCQAAIGALCSRSADVKSGIARLFGITLAVLAVPAAGVYVAGRFRRQMRRRTTTALLVRWILGTALIVLGLLLTFTSLASAPERSCVDDRCVTYDHSLVQTQQAGFGIGLAAAALNLFPRRVASLEDQLVPQDAGP
jgi:hypothetical protein